MDHHPPKAAAVRRSACDQCRAKRVRCLRAENSTAPCARCSQAGLRCVTGAPGRPGRPHKQQRPVIDGDGSVPRGSAAASSPSAAICSRTGRSRTTSTLSTVELVDPSVISGSKVSLSKPAVPSPRDPSAHPPQPDFWDWEAPPDSAFLGASIPSLEQDLAPGEDVPALVDHLSGPSQPLGPPLSADDGLDLMFHADALNMDVDPLLDPWEGLLPRPSPLLPRCVSAASSLIRFREDMVQRIVALDPYFSNPFQVMKSCEDEGSEQGRNPAAILLKCSEEFIAIIRTMIPPARPQMTPKDAYLLNLHQLVPPATMHTHSTTTTEDALSTEVVLLALSGYLALMRLYDSLFHCIYTFLCQMPPGSFKSVKVKSVLRIGDISSLQDVPLKTYATGILDVVRAQVQTLERCMGVSAEYCLSPTDVAAAGGGAAAAAATASSHTAAAAAAAAAPGLFGRPDRARLFREAMAQEDVKPQRGGKSYAGSIQASIQDSVAFLD